RTTIPDDRIAALAREVPALFLVQVLAGEEPIDFIQRRWLATAQARHPLLDRINRLHCKDEARHLSFGRTALRDALGQLTSDEVRRVRYEAPLTVIKVAGHMLVPRSEQMARWGIPDDVQHDLTHGAVFRGLLLASTSKTAAIFNDAGLID